MNETKETQNKFRTDKSGNFIEPMNLPPRKEKNAEPRFPMKGDARAILKSLPGIQWEVEKAVAAFQADSLNGECRKPLLIMGGAGSGKTTERKRLVKALQAAGFSAVPCVARDRDEMTEFLVSTFAESPRKLRVIYADEIHNRAGGALSPWEVMKELWNGDGAPVEHTLNHSVKVEKKVETVPVTFTYHPCETVWILSSNVETRDPALMRRCHEAVFRPLGEKGIRSLVLSIFTQQGISFLLESKACLDFIAGNVRPNGGAIECLADRLRKECKFASITGEALPLIRSLFVSAGIGLDGWTREHVAILEAAETAFLGQKRPTLGDYGVSALEGRGDAAASRLITELIGAGFMVTSSGKTITPAGRGFLAFFRQWAKESGFTVGNLNA
jgi:hypothetical protein